MKKNLLNHVAYMTKLFTIAFIIQCLTMSFLLAWNGNAQVKSIEEVRVFLSLDDVKIEEAFEKLEKHTSYNFVFATREIKDLPLISFESDGRSLYDVLADISVQAKLNFKQVDLNIHVKKSDVDRKVAVVENVDVTVSGTVRDENGEPIPGVTVSVQGTGIGTATDVEGRYSLSVPEGSTLIFSFIGFESQNIAVGERSVIDVVLSEDMASLDEVVVVGYGTMRKQDVTGAVSMVDLDNVKDIPVASIDQKLIGQLPGVKVQSLSGVPGGGMSIEIRGLGSVGAGNQPLYVIDGMPYSSEGGLDLNPLSYLSPADIESITVLKDASSTAIYGSRGANGVVIVNTKSGSYNKTQIGVSMTTGIQQVPQKGRPELMNQQEFAHLQRDRIAALIRDREDRVATEDDYPIEYRNPEQLMGPGTDWYDLILRTAKTQDYNLQVSRGNDHTKYSLNLGYFDQQGVIKHTGFNRITGKLMVESKLGDAVKIGASISSSFINQNRILTNHGRNDDLGNAMWINPVMKPFDENGNIIPYIESPYNPYKSAFSTVNPLYALQETTREVDNFQSLGNIYGNWEIIEGLSYRVSFNTITENSDFFYFKPSTVGRENSKPTDASFGTSHTNKSKSFNWLIENTMTYDRSFGEGHHLNALLGYTAQSYSRDGINLDAAPYPADIIQTINAAQGITNWNEIAEKWRMTSYLGRLNYNYKDRYLLTATWRRDGSSRFGRYNRFASFPSFAVAWTASEEAFMKSVTAIDELKLRLSYGSSGNNNIGNYNHIARINSGDYLIGGSQVAALSVGVGNPYLTWEQSNQLDAGIDLYLFKNRLRFVADYYSRKSHNMLISNKIPAITGHTSQTINIGNVQNQGVEFDLGISPIRGEFVWDLNVNLALNRNKVLTLNQDNEPIYSGNNDNNPTHVTMVGKPIAMFYGYVFDGLVTAEDLADPNFPSRANARLGGEKFKDLNEDGIRNGEDRTIIGNPHEKFFFGFTNRFQYKGADLTIVAHGQYGGSVVNGLRQTLDNLNAHFNMHKEWVNRWRSPEDPGDGKHGSVPGQIGASAHTFSDLWIEDASFLKISNVTLGYSIPKSIGGRFGYDGNLRLYVTGQNLLMLTKYKGANPEAQSFNRSIDLAPGWDIASYPLARTLSAGLSLAF